MAEPHRCRTVECCEENADPPPTAEEICRAWAESASVEEIQDAIAGAEFSNLTDAELEVLRAALSLREVRRG